MASGEPLTDPLRPAPESLGHTRTRRPAPPLSVGLRACCGSALRSECLCGPLSGPVLPVSLLVRLFACVGLKYGNLRASESLGQTRSATGRSEPLCAALRRSIRAG